MVDVSRTIETTRSEQLLIAQKHPSLRPLRHHLSLLNAHFAFQSNNAKFSRALLRRLIASFTPSDPPSIVYVAHLALITQLTSTSATSQDTATVAPELQAALSAITALSMFAAQNRHPAIEDLAAVLPRALCLTFNDEEDVKHPKCQESPEAKQPTPEPLMRSYSITARDVHNNASTESQLQSNATAPHLDNVPEAGSPKNASPTQRPKATDALTLSFTAHVLILGTIYHTHAGCARSVEPRLAAFHTLMDSGTLVGGTNADGLVEIPLPGHGLVHLRTTHPRILFLLTFLLSAVAKRDPVGRRPKKRVFAECGVTRYREGREGSVSLNVPLWASWGAVEEIEQRTLRIEADLLCELVAVSIQQSDFDAAENHLATLIAHTRTYDFFPAYAARIALHHAHLAHAVGNTEHAGICYRVAAHLDGAGPVVSDVTLGGGFIAAAARAGEALLRIGLAAAQSPPFAKDALARCSASSSAPLPALGALISAALSRSLIIKSKTLLKHALALLGAAGDNHLRALVLAVVGAQYVYTTPAHAMEVLAVCETLGAGMGAHPNKPKEDEIATVQPLEGSETPTRR
ncbi:hypothetical protein BU15DRAFT_81697 [Melanogaster broomeanus]|nr:hypothetical protein BU15DRAFT_81697 [Melanogaster broomeanus]